MSVVSSSTMIKPMMFFRNRRRYIISMFLIILAAGCFVADAKSIKSRRHIHDTTRVKRCGMSLERQLAWVCGVEKYEFPFPKPSYHKTNQIALQVTKANDYVHTAYSCCKRGCDTRDYQKLCQLNSIWKDCQYNRKNLNKAEKKLCTRSIRKKSRRP